MTFKLAWTTQFRDMRKRSAKKRPLLPDPRFNDQLVTRFVNNLMWSGKKSIAFTIFYDAIDIVDEKKQDDDKSALELWKEALTNVMPHVEVRSRRIGGATFDSQSHSSRPQNFHSNEVVDFICQKTQWKINGSKTRCRNSCCFQRGRRSCQKTRWHTQNGRSKQSILSL